MIRNPSPVPEPPVADYLGRRLGDFRLVERIGGGGVGSIYRAEQVGLDRPAVVKILKARMAEDETTRLRFLREARLASTLDHPYAAHVYAFGVEPDGLQWIAMELVRGTPLSEILKGGQRIPLVTFIPFIERFCQVVQTAHDHGIVHRDIKPQNVMVIERAGASLPKLLDLGLAKDMSRVLEPTLPSGSRAVEEARDGAISSARGLALAPLSSPRFDDVPRSGPLSSEDVNVLTHEGDVMGSPSYMAPEQWEAAEKVGFPADIYALGVLCFEALAGRRPFVGTLTNLAEQHLTAKLPALPPDLPKELHAVLARAMAKAPEDRPTSAIALARDLRTASGLETDLTATPKLVREVAEIALRDYPQPIAEAVAEVEGARSAFEAIEAAVRLSRVIVRYLAVVALAAYDTSKGRSLPPGASTATAAATSAAEILSALRGRRLEDDEWLELARGLTTPYARDAERHPIPPLVRTLAFDTQVWEALGVALKKQASTEGPTPVLAAVSRALEGLRFLAEYPLAVVTDTGRAELWTGVRRTRRVVCAIDPNAKVARGGAVVVCSGGGLRAGGTPGARLAVPIGSGRVVQLAPYAVVSRPSANAAEELFLLEGRGRRGVLLVAFPMGFEKTSEAALERLRRLSASSDQTERNSAALDVPYRGLAPLTAADADIFFGREREVEAFVNRLRVEPLLALVGPSGAGKSSFVRAGVVPSLDGAFHAVVLRPGATPLETLRAKLSAFGVELRGATREIEPREVAARVHEAANARDETLVVVVDQFEETFTLTRDAGERASFCAWLMAIAGTPSAPARVVLTLRDDFLVRAQQESALENRLASALELLAPLNDASLRRILVEPARRAGFAFENDALVDTMVRAVEGHAGALALLSFAASKLWEQRDVEATTMTTAAYVEMGGVGGALARHAEAVLERLTSAQRALVRRAFRRLVTADGTRAVTALDELLALLANPRTGDDAEAARIVVERLVAARLLVVAEADDGTERIEIIHEALLSAWPRLVEWQREDAAGARLRDQIQLATRAWDSRGRPRDLLWRDALVDEYLRWREANPKTLTPTEEAFCAACVAEKNRGRRLRTGLTALFAAAALITSYVAWQQNLAKKQAETAIQVAEAANVRAEQSAFRARDAARLAAARTTASDPTMQLALLREVEASTPLPDWAPATRAALHGGVAFVLDHPAEIIAVAYAADGKRVVTGGMDYALRVWHVDGTGAPVTLRGHTNAIVSIAVSPDGRRIASGSWDGTVRVWNDDGAGEPVVLHHPNRVLAVAFSPDGRRIATGSRDGAVRVWGADGREEPRVLSGHGGGVTSVSFGPDGRRLASASLDKSARIWDLDASTPPIALVGHTEPVQAVSFSPDGTHVVTASNDKSIRIWQADGRAPPVVLDGHEGGVYAARYSPDGTHVASASFDATVRLWSLTRPRDPVVFRGHSVPVYDVAFAPDGQHLASASEDKTVRIWSLAETMDPRVVRTPSIPNGVAIARDGSHIAAALDDCDAYVYPIDGHADGVRLHGHTDRLNGVAFSPDGRKVATTSYDHTVRIWNADGSGLPTVLAGHSEVANGVAFSPDGARVASGSQDRTLRIWSLADPSAKPLVLRADDTLNGIAFSADGERVAAASKDGTVYVWASRREGLPTTLRGHTGQATGVSFSPDGRTLASSSFDGSVRLWNLAAGGDARVLRGHTERVVSVVFSPDGEMLASAAMDKTVRIWSAASDALPVVLHGDNDLLLDLAWGADGRRILASSADKTLRIWTDFAPLAPSDPRLWRATNLCPSVDLRKQLLGIEDSVARSHFARCTERVAAAR